MTPFHTIIYSKKSPLTHIRVEGISISSYIFALRYRMGKPEAGTFARFRIDTNNASQLPDNTLTDNYYNRLPKTKTQECNTHVKVLYEVCITHVTSSSHLCNVKKQIKNMKLFFFTLLTILLAVTQVSAGVIKGSITDKQTKEPLIGATVQVAGSSTGVVADIEGSYTLSIANGTYNIEVKYIGYKPISLKGVHIEDETLLNFEMEPDTQTLADVTVVAQAKRNTELAQLSEQRRSLVVQSGVSAQQISKTQDKDASEVIKRIPGVSIIDEKFVMVRGLSQRYNNVWVNGSAVPSSEADSRAFSFDIIPSSQLDNMVIVKSPSPEYPADFTGGFILINTKEMPGKSGLNISVGGNLNDQTHFRSFYYNPGSGTDFLGFDNGLRSLNAGMKGTMNTYPGSATDIDVLRNGFNNNWNIKRMQPAGDLKLNANYSYRWDAESGRSYGLLLAANYSNSFKSYRNMENSLYGAYDTSNNQSVYMRRSVDDQYVNDVRVGGMLNFTFQPKDSRQHYEWKNIFNQLGKSKYTERRGFNAQNDNEHNMEYYYSSRTTYNTQYTGKYTLDEGKLDWSVGYAYANRNLPDRRLIELNDRSNNTMGLYRISREFTRLDEHIASGNLNYQKDFTFGTFTPTLRTGAYGEYRTRTYNTREFQYGYDPTITTLPNGFQYTENIANDLLVDSNYGTDKLYIQEEVDKRNNYSGNQIQAAGYAGASLPLGKLNVYAGIRYEFSRLELITNTRAHEESPISTYYDYNDFFPTVNLNYRLTGKQQLRLAYGKSVNRAEFRELSPAVYYDFDLASNVMGNSELKSCYVHNVDLRYEWYPTSGEQISVALFYKRFNSPIEWTYTVTGGTDLIYSYMNAKSANNYGVEVDIRKNLDFIGLKDFSWNFNAAWIKSQVEFTKGSNEKNRPMQGQSPYLINTGVFYQHTEHGWNTAILYNRIGKRIVGVGRSMGSSAEDTKNIPNSYEMPRNTIDLSVGKRLGNWELKVSVRDLLAEKVIFKQIDEVTVNQQTKSIEEVTKQFKPGRNFSLTVSYQF